MKTLLMAVTALAFAAAGTMPASAQYGSRMKIQQVFDSTPSCSEHPSAPWIGRVSGGTENLMGGTRTISFVGCFATQAKCERWKGQTSGIILTTIIQYSCKPRD